MAPEVLCAQNHSYPVDFFAIGVMGYEFMLGHRPYLGRSRREIKQAVLRKQALITTDQLPQGWSSSSIDFINKCLQRKEIKRLGYMNGISELKQHEWFDNFEWSKLATKTIKSPFTIKGEFNYDKKYCESLDKLSPETIERYQSYMKKEDFISLFVNYTCLDNLYLYNSDTQDVNNTNISNTSNARGTRITFTKASTNTNSSLNNYNNNNAAKEEYAPFKKGNKFVKEITNQRFRLNPTLLKKSLSAATFNKQESNYYKRETISRESRVDNNKKEDDVIKSKSYAESISDNTNLINNNSNGFRHMKFNFGNVNVLRKHEGSQSCKMFPYQGKPIIDTGSKSILPNINVLNGYKFSKNNFYRFYNAKKITGLNKNKLSNNNNNNHSSGNQFNPLMGHTNRGFFLKKSESAGSLSSLIRPKNVL